MNIKEEQAHVEENDWMEFEAKSLDEVIEKACTALNTTHAYLEFEKINPKGTKIKARKSDTPQNVIAPDEDFEDEVIDETEDSAGNQLKAGEKRHGEISETELGKAAKEALEKIVSYIHPDAEVELSETNEEIYLDIIGDGSGVIIGKHGQTLEAFQHIVAKILGLDRNTKKRLVLDAEGYRERRQNTLKSMAIKMATKAKRSRRAVNLEPMGAMDRRVIHLALAERDDVETKSVGEGMSRRVVIVPKGARAVAPRREDTGRRSRNEGPRRQERSGKSKAALIGRRNDSFDTPPAPSMERFPEDIDDLVDLPEDELHARLEEMNQRAEDVKPRLITSLEELEDKDKPEA